MPFVLTFLVGLVCGMILGGGIRWGAIAADFRRRFWGDGPNVRIWWSGEGQTYVSQWRP